MTAMKQRNAILALLALILVCLSLSQPHTLGCSTNGLVAHYAFNGDATDDSGNGLNGAIINAAFMTAQADLGLSFVSAASYVEVPHNDVLSPSNAVSVSVWVNARSFPNSYCCLVYKAATTPTGQGFQDRSYSLWVRSDGGIHWTSTAEDMGSQTICESAGGGVAFGQWVHVVAVVDATAQFMKVYLNGKEAASTPYSSAGINYGTFPLRIGGPFITVADQTGLDGVLDDVRIYSRALTADDVACLYAVTAHEPSLAIRKTDASQVELCWTSQSNATYQVQYCADLTTSPWSTLGGCVAGTGTTNWVYDTIPDPASQRFYRVVVTNCVPSM